MLCVWHMSHGDIASMRRGISLDDLQGSPWDSGQVWSGTGVERNLLVVSEGGCGNVCMVWPETETREVYRRHTLSRDEYERVHTSHTSHTPPVSRHLSRDEYEAAHRRVVPGVARDDGKQTLLDQLGLRSVRWGMRRCGVWSVEAYVPV